MTTEGTTLPQDQVTDVKPQELPAATVVLTDPDEIELAEAKTAAQAEEAAKGAATTVPVEAKTDPTPKPADTSKDIKAPVNTGGPMIPKARLDEALDKGAKAQQDAAYWRGVAEARATPGAAKPGEQPPKPAAPTLEDRRAAIATQIEALAKKFDDGEITYTDLKKQERELTKQEDVLREEALLAKVKPAAPAAPTATDELYLDQLTAQLEKDHPWVAVFDQVAGNADWGYLRSLAIDNLTARGIDVTKGNIGKFELRKEIAILADAYGPALLTDRAKAKGITLPGTSQTPPAPAPKPGLSPQATARQAKLTTQQEAPPDLNRMSGAIGDAPGQVSDAAIEAMSDDEIGKLPDAVRRKLLGITAT